MDYPDSTKLFSLLENRDVVGLWCWFGKWKISWHHRCKYPSRFSKSIFNKLAGSQLTFKIWYKYGHYSSRLQLCTFKENLFLLWCPNKYLTKSQLSKIKTTKFICPFSFLLDKSFMGNRDALETETKTFFMMQQ